MRLQVLVLNASYEPLNVCSVRRAHVLVYKGKAEVLEELETPLRSATDTFPRPHVIRLVQYVRVPAAGEAEDLAAGALRPRRWSCVYCGTSGGRLTLDHVVPRAGAATRSGRTSSPPARPATCARATGCRRRCR